MILIIQTSRLILQLLRIGKLQGNDCMFDPVLIGKIAKNMKKQTILVEVYVIFFHIVVLVLLNQEGRFFGK